MGRMKIPRLVCLLVLMISLIPSLFVGIATAHTSSDPFVTALIAGGGNPKSAMCAGTVQVWNDCDYIYVKYTTACGWCITETHLHIATSLSGIPQNNGNPTSGRFQYSNTHGCVTEYIYVIPRIWAYGTTVYIAAHAVVQRCGCGYGCGDGSETAWAAGCKFPGRNWATYFCYTVQAPTPPFSATITCPANGATIPVTDMGGWWIGSTDVYGTFSGTPASDRFWVLLCTADMGWTYPQPFAQLDTATHTWSAWWQVYIAGGMPDTNKTFKIVLVEVTQATNDAYWAYKAHGDSTGEWPGMPIQLGTTIWASVTVYTALSS